MKTKNLTILTVIAFLAITSTVKAQLFDGFAQKKGDLSLTASFTYSSFDEIYADEESVPLSMVGIEEATQNIYSLYVKYGISDNVTAVLNLPYITSDGGGSVDVFNGETSFSDFQDLRLAVKVNAYKFNFKSSNLNIITGLGVTIPLGYEPNGLLTIGNNAWGVEYTAGLHLNTDVGFFSTIFANYNLRADSKSNANNIKTTYAVPNYFSTHGKIGYASDFIYAEVWATYVNSDEGVDILGEGFTGNFPEVNVESSAVGITLYKNVLPQLGVSIGYGNTFDGRNTIPSEQYSVGVTYNLTR